jgi:Nif-specific regulatory protein
VVQAQDLPRAIRISAAPPATGSHGQPPAPQAPSSAQDPFPAAAAPEGHSRADYLKDLERGELLRALEGTGWVIARAARALGWTPRQVAYKMKKFGLSSPWKH